MTPQPDKFSPLDFAQCARRELSHRRRVYPRLVYQRKMTVETAEREIALMEAIKEYFEQLDQPNLL